MNGPIQIINLKSKNRHYVIGETGSHWKPFTFGALKGYSTMPNWNHWPVAQLPNDGRVTPAPDRPSATCLGTLYPVRHKGEGVQEWVRDLYGMTDKEPKDLAVLGRSWNTPAELKVAGNAFRAKGYDKNQRAYVLACNEASQPATLEMTLAGSQASPVLNPAFVIQGWGERGARLRLDGREIPRGKDFRFGQVFTLEGTDLVVWLHLESMQPTTLRLSPETQ